MEHMTRIIRIVLLIFCATASIAGPCRADEVTLRKLSSDAEQVFKSFMASSDVRIPQTVLSEAKAIAIFPSVIHGGCLIGGQYGRGIVLSRDDSGEWKVRALSTIRGASAGLQLGIEATDLILVAMSEKAMHGFLSDRMSLGTGLTLLVGSAGTSLKVGTDNLFRPDVLGYSKNRGFFGGLVVSGASVSPESFGADEKLASTLLKDLIQALRRQSKAPHVET